VWYPACAAASARRAACLPACLPSSLSLPANHVHSTPITLPHRPARLLRVGADAGTPAVITAPPSSSVPRVAVSLDGSPVASRRSREALRVASPASVGSGTPEPHPPTRTSAGAAAAGPPPTGRRETVVGVGAGAGAGAGSATPARPRTLGGAGAAGAAATAAVGSPAPVEGLLPATPISVAFVSTPVAATAAGAGAGGAGDRTAPGRERAARDRSSVGSVGYTGSGSAAATPAPTPAAAAATPAATPMAGARAEGDANVRVLVRPRPLNALERERNGDETCVTMEGNSVRLLKTDTTLTFDHVFPPTCPQEAVFAQVGPSSVAGGWACVWAGLCARGCCLGACGCVRVRVRVCACGVMLCMCVPTPAAPLCAQPLVYPATNSTPTPPLRLARACALARRRRAVRLQRHRVCIRPNRQWEDVHYDGGCCVRACAYEGRTAFRTRCWELCTLTVSAPLPPPATTPRAWTTLRAVATMQPE
jgi:hypothetical protein